MELHSQAANVGRPLTVLHLPPSIISLRRGRAAQASDETAAESD
jgi:hypothetical protein